MTTWREGLWPEVSGDAEEDSLAVGTGAKAGTGVDSLLDRHVSLKASRILHHPGVEFLSAGQADALGDGPEPEIDVAG